MNVIGTTEIILNMFPFILGSLANGKIWGAVGEMTGTSKKGAQ